MKAVMSEVPSFILQWRQQTGATRWDEIWEGVLHMPPMPNRDHQELEGDLEWWLHEWWEGTGDNRVYHQINLAGIGGWPSNYRIPDLVLLSPDRFHIDHNEYFEGPPNVVVEIRSPGDETLEKMPFYASLRVPEVWIIDRDTRVPEVHVFVGGEYRSAAPDADGWILSEATGIMLRADAGKRLALQLAANAASLRVIPKVRIR